MNDSKLTDTVAGSAHTDAAGAQENGAQTRARATLERVGGASAADTATPCAPVGAPSLQHVAGVLILNAADCHHLLKGQQAKSGRFLVTPADWAQLETLARYLDVSSPSVLASRVLSYALRTAGESVLYKAAGRGRI